MILEDFLLWGCVGRVVCLLLGFFGPSRVENIELC